ncbi:Uncharacterised protein [Mycobacterium tuberculosis]|nr:Uncharacterised protein [Mycobacterium tuberculosis]
MRTLSVAMPGLEHRQTVVAQAGHHGPARPLDGQGALHPGPKGCQRGRRGRSPRASSRAGIGVRSSARAWTGAGDSPAGRHRGTGWRYRSRRLVVMCDLWCLRRAVPGGYRTCRSHRRYAPLPGDDGVGVPLRAVGAVQEPGDQGQPVGSERLRSHQLDRRG